MSWEAIWLRFPIKIEGGEEIKGFQQRERLLCKGKIFFIMHAMFPYAGFQDNKTYNKVQQSCDFIFKNPTLLFLAVLLTN